MIHSPTTFIWCMKMLWSASQKSSGADSFLILLMDRFWTQELDMLRHVGWTVRNLGNWSDARRLIVRGSLTCSIGISHSVYPLESSEVLRWATQKTGSIVRIRNIMKFEGPNWKYGKFFVHCDKCLMVSCIVPYHPHDWMQNQKPLKEQILLMDCEKTSQLYSSNCWWTFFANIPLGFMNSKGTCLLHNSNILKQSKTYLKHSKTYSNLLKHISKILKPPKTIPSLLT